MLTPITHVALDGPARCDGGRQALAGSERGRVAATKYLIKALLSNSFDLVSVAVRFWPISHTDSHDTTDVGAYDLMPCPSLSLRLTRNERAEPNWGKPLPPIPVLPTEFEMEVTRLGLAKSLYTASAELKRWCDRNRSRVYVHEWLLTEWGMQVEDFSGRRDALVTPPSVM